MLNQLATQSTNQQINIDQSNQPINKSISINQIDQYSTNQSINQPTNQSTNHSINQSTHQQINTELNQSSKRLSYKRQITLAQSAQNHVPLRRWQRFLFLPLGKKNTTNRAVLLCARNAAVYLIISITNQSSSSSYIDPSSSPQIDHPSSITKINHLYIINQPSSSSQTNHLVIMYKKKRFCLRTFARIFADR